MAEPDTDTPIIPDGVTLRAFDDAKAARDGIYEGTLAAVKARFPLENRRYRLELSDVRYTGPREFTLAQQKDALLHDKNLHTPLSGHYRLVDKETNRVVDERDDVVMNVPYYTDRGTIINNGSEYTIANQLRLRPGVYTRIRRSGDVETQFNVRPGTGRGFRIRLDPATGVMNVNVGHANMPLYALLRAMGVTDRQMIASWGAETAAANQAKANTGAGRQAVDKLYKAFAGYNATASDLVSKERYLADTLPKFELDPGVTARTLGIDARGITPELLLRAAQKTLNVNRGEERPDDRDNPGFANVFGVEDLYRERIEKDAGRLGRTLMMKIARAGSLRPLGRGAFSGWHHELLQGSGLAMPGDNSNPMANEEQMMRVTRMGEGGIGSADVVTDEARNVNPGNLNFIGPIEGPENEKIGVDARLAVHTRKGSDGKLYSLFVNRDGRREYVACDRASDSVIGFPGSSPKDREVPAMKDGKVQMVPRGEVDYFMPDMAGMFSANINLNPMPTAVQGGRQFYGAKFWGQYMPTVDGETPLVDSLMPDGKATWSEYYGRRLGTLKAGVDGKVVKVTDKGVTVRAKDGTKRFIETVKDFSFNGLTSLTYTPTVKVGDKVRADDMVAASNYVDPKTGGLAMGHNLRVAWISYLGHSYEDAIVLSESAAKKMATNRLYNFEADPKSGVELGLNRYMSMFPQRFSREQFATLDDNGVVKPGTVLNKGDPIAVGVGPKLLSAEDAQLGKLHKTLRSAFTDRAQVWEHDYPGTVVDSAVFRGRAKVHVRATPQMQIGDKLSPRFALKGVIGKIVPDDEMPRDAATNEPFDILMNPMGIPSRVAPGQLIETALGKLAKATGRQVRIPQDPPPEGWANWAKAQLDAAGVPDRTDIFDPRTGRTIKGIGDGYVYYHAMHHIADKKLSAKGGAGGYTADLQPAKGGPHGAKRNCFVASQAIRVLHGEESIGHIVEKRIPEYVWTRFDDGSWGYSRVTNWFCRKGRLSEVIAIDVDGLPGSDNCGRKRVVYTRKTLKVTRQHHVFSPDRGEMLAGDLRPGDWLTSYGYVPTDDQLSLLMGSMLGDGAICNVNDNLHKQRQGICTSMPYYSERHSHHQDRYVNWKLHALGALVSSRSMTQNKSRSGFSSKPGQRVAYYDVHRHDIVESLKNMFYRQPDGSLGPKNLSHVDLDLINDVGIVAWFLDDGCVTTHVRGGVDHGGPTGNIATHGFTEADNRRLAGWLGSRLGVDIPVRRTSGTRDGVRHEYFYLGLPAEACRRLARMVARYVRPEDIPPSRRWLVSEASRLASEYVGVDTAYSLGSVPVLVTDVRPYSDGKHGPDDEICLYDLTVEGSHKYCASDCLVSNSGLDVNALLAHGATDVLKDIQTVRGSKNEDYWRAVRGGGPLPEPGVPFVYTKAMNLLRAGGINVVEGQKATDIMPMTDRDVDALAGGRYIENGRMLDADMHDIRGGLFDPVATGGSGNDRRWAAIRLPEPIPNPVMEEPVRRVLGLTTKRLKAIISGAESVDGKTGGAALASLLGKIDVDAEIARQKEIVRKTRGSARDNAVKVIGYLSGCKKQGVTPKDWMITKVPVIPPMFRPVAKLGDTALVSDINELYRDVIESADAFSALRGELPDSGLVEERLNVYNAVKAAYGLGDPISPEGQAKRLKGAIRQVIGSSPKLGLFQSKVLSKAVDGVGRGVISPEPNYDMDQCGIPEESAWTLYKDYVIRELTRHGYPQVRAMELIDARAPVAKDILVREMARRPVILDRAPTWHKFNLMAFWPHIVEGSTIRMNPVVEKAYTADHDGDDQIGQVRVKFDGFLDLKNTDKEKDTVYCKGIKNMVYFLSLQEKEMGNDA